MASPRHETTVDVAMMTESEELKILRGRQMVQVAMLTVLLDRMGGKAKITEQDYLRVNGKGIRHSQNQGIVTLELIDVGPARTLSKQ